MKFIKNTLGFMVVMGCLPASYAATARPSVTGAMISRMPTISTSIVGGTTSSTSSTLSDIECMDAYTACAKGADVCGPDFEECTTDVLFHGQMPECLSVLAQCSTAGINSLFGTSSTTSLSTVAATNTYGEVTDYTYPTDGSVLGQMISAAAITNRYDTADCVKRYTSCLNRSSVCGSDFELCTTNSEFKKQMVACDSTLARCQGEGKTELFGSTNTLVSPNTDSRIGEMIANGAGLAAVNAVSTCYKVADQCILSACALNPYECNEGASAETVALVDSINNGDTSLPATDVYADAITSSGVAAYIQNSCMSTIGSNKYCYATFLGNGSMPTAKQLKDEGNQEEVYAEAYSARMNAGMKAMISDLIEKFDTKAKEKCTDTIKSCVMRVCGSGSGAACYSQVFGNADKSINNEAGYAEIKTGCSAIVNTDPYCNYAAQNPNDTGLFNYMYMNADAFTTLFPEYDDGSENDPIGVVAGLNATLATSYSDAAIANMKRQCQLVATSCVKSMCGADYTNCYRNRTDIYSSLTNSGNAAFDKSMNKVGGVLDSTVVLGLCLETVKTASICEEHLAIEKNKLKISNSATDSWGAGTSSVRGGWLDAGSAIGVSVLDEGIQAKNSNGELLCSSNEGLEGVCNTVDAAGNMFITPIMLSEDTYITTQAATSLFKDLIYDIEKEAQAKYNAKLTNEQNMCMAANNGGLMGKNDLGSTYLWAKLKSNKVPKDYSVSGLEDKDFVASNELYGSFCRIRVTVQSDDKNVQEKIAAGADWSSAYFAVGDAFTCGSWIKSDDLEEIANAVGDKAVEGKAEANAKTRGWITLAGTLGLGGAGWAWGDSIIEGKSMSNLTGLSEKKSTSTKKDGNYIETQAGYCKEYVDAAKKAIKSNNKSEAYSNTEMAIASAKNAGVKMDVRNAAKTAVADLAYGTGSDVNKLTGGTTEPAYEALNRLNDACVFAERNPSDSDNKEDDDDNKNGWIAPVTAGVTALAGGLITHYATKDIQDAQLTKEQKAAYDEWMDEVGQHINCYIGADEIGSYGDVISTSVE